MSSPTKYDAPQEQVENTNAVIANDQREQLDSNSPTLEQIPDVPQTAPTSPPDEGPQQQPAEKTNVQSAGQSEGTNKANVSTVSESGANMMKRMVEACALAPPGQRPKVAPIPTNDSRPDSATTATSSVDQRSVATPNKRAPSPLFDVSEHHRQEASTLLARFPRRRPGQPMSRRQVATPSGKSNNSITSSKPASGQKKRNPVPKTPPMLLLSTSGAPLVESNPNSIIVTDHHSEGESDDSSSPLSIASSKADNIENSSSSMRPKKLGFAIQEEPVSSPTLRSNSSKFGSMSGHQHALESRRKASMRFLKRGRKIPISTKDMINVYRLATMESSHKSDAIEVELVSRNYKLGWLFRPANERPKEWMTLENMREDFLEEGGNELDNVPLINSPRSVLTLLRGGQHPMALQRMNKIKLRQQMSIEGASIALIEQRFSFLDDLRVNELKSLRTDYELLCQRFPREEVNIFFELLDPKDLSQLPEITEDPDGICRVKVPTDDSLAAAMDGINAKVEKDRARIKKKLAMEINSSQKLVQQRERDQERNLQAAIKQQAHADKIAADKRQENTLRRMAAQAKAERRAYALKRTEEQRLASIKAREARAALVEEEAATAQQQRLEDRHDRTRKKQATRKERMDHSAHVAKLNEERREAQLREKDGFRVEQAKRREQQREEQKLVNIENAKVNAARRAEIIERSEALLREREERAEARQAAVEERLQEFEEEKKTKVQIHRLRELKKNIHREEIFNEAVEREEKRIEHELERRQEQMDAFYAFKKQQKEQRTQRREIEIELKKVKKDFVQRNENKKQYEQLQLVDELLFKKTKCGKMDSIRDQLVVKARDERETLQNFRSKKLHETADNSVIWERKSYFNVFTRTTPSALAELNKEREQRKARRAKALRAVALANRNGGDSMSDVHQQRRAQSSIGFEAHDETHDEPRPHSAEPLALD